MTVIVDANLLVVMVSGDARGPLASEQVESWITAGEDMHAPELPVVQHPLTDDLPRVVDIALRLKRQSAYGAAYIALAEDLHATLWTLDGPLAQNAKAAGFPVRLLSEAE